MPHVFLSIIAPLPLDKLADAAAAIDALGNPAGAEMAQAFGTLDGAGDGIHFASMHAFASADGKRGYLLLECSGDGTTASVIARLMTVERLLQPIFRLATDWVDGTALDAFMTSRAVSAGGGWLDHPGLNFTGSPGLNVGRILAEARLGARAAALLAVQPAGGSALSRLNAVRAVLAREPEHATMLVPPPPVPPFMAATPLALLPSLVASFCKTYLWPLGIAIALWAIWRGWLFGHNAPHAPLAFLWFGLCGAVVGAVISLAVVLVLLGGSFFMLRHLERADVPSETEADRATNAAMFARENHAAQNHMISITQRKPGPVRNFTSRAIFWVIGQLAGSYYPPGFLSDIGSIHFARWVTPPGSPDLIFLSNYGGSWESYLEDFITLAHAGLTGVWSNTIGFPRSENLIGEGATDGERFKRFARASMIPTRFWFSAYPALTTSNIRSNSLIRAGVAVAASEDEAVRWLELFGSAARPSGGMVNNDVQSLILGGLGFLGFGACLLCGLPRDVSGARGWLRDVGDHIAYNDGRRITRDAVVTLALAAPGLARLGLAPEALATFPFTFLEGPATATRARMLGDIGASDPAGWAWGRQPSDAVLLVYGRTQAAVDELVGKLAKDPRLSGSHRIPLRPVQKTEPFGFADGLSQPVIRGTHKALRSGDPLHLVEPGEFVLGYKDNRGNLPPGPCLPAAGDPANLLPLLATVTDFGRPVAAASRDLGFNGSYLVIRQLEQDTAAFGAYCAAQAEAVRDSFPFDITPEFIGAKLIGRWQDGSPLVRHPQHPPQEEKRIYQSHALVSRKMSALQGGAAEGTPATARVTPEAMPGGAVTPPIGGSHRIENDFLFGTEDPQALRCPYGAHIRRSNPRDSFTPGSTEQIGITNRHRIIRVGRQYEPAAGENPGLLFMCLNGDIERQFEFLQQTWIGNPSFHGLSGEADPLQGETQGRRSGFTIPTVEGPVSLATVPDFVTTKGAGYFFIPGRRLVEYLCHSV